MKNQFIETGKIVAPFGIKGEVKIYPWSDSPEAVAKLKKLYIRGGSEMLSVSSRVHGGNMVVSKIEGVNTVEEAEKLRNYVVYLDRNDFPLPKGCYFHKDLLGLSVIDADSDRVYGILSDIFSTGAGEIYTIKAENGKEYMIPVIPDVIVKTDLEGGVLKIRALKGIFDDED